MNPDSIQFFTEEIEYRLRDKRELRGDLERVIIQEKFLYGPVNFILCSDAFLKEYNKRFLNHNYFTDVITFDYSEEENYVTGDVFISLDRIRENAKSYQVSSRKELLRVMIHGLLHLMGMNDQSEEEKKAMREKEDYYLKYLRK